MLATLRQRNFALLWCAGLISIIGDWVLIATVPFHVYTLTGSALAASAMLIAYTLPGLLFGSVAGVFVDRWDRRRTMIGVNLLRAPLLLLLLGVRSPEWVWVVYLTVFMESTLGQFFGPAESALLPTLVEEKYLIAANALNTLNNNFARLIGPSIGAAIMAVAGLPGVVFADSASYLVSAVLIALVHTRVAPIERPAAVATPALRESWVRVGREWVEGLRLVRGNRVVVALFIVLGAAAVADGFNSSLLVPFVKDVLGGSTREFAWLLTAQAVSGMIAGVLIGHVGNRVRPGYLIALSAGIAAVLFMIAYNIPILALVLALGTLLGFPSVGFYVTTQTLLQSSVADQYRGRVFGALGTTNALLALCTLGIAGSLADRLGVRPVLNVVVALWFFTALVAWVSLRGARTTQEATTPSPSRPHSARPDSATDGP